MICVFYLFGYKLFRILGLVYCLDYPYSLVSFICEQLNLEVLSMFNKIDAELLSKIKITLLIIGVVAAWIGIQLFPEDY